MTDAHPLSGGKQECKVSSVQLLYTTNKAVVVFAMNFLVGTGLKDGDAGSN